MFVLPGKHVKKLHCISFHFICKQTWKTLVNYKIAHQRFTGKSNTMAVVLKRIPSVNFVVGSSLLSLSAGQKLSVLGGLPTTHCGLTADLEYNLLSWVQSVIKCPKHFIILFFVLMTDSWTKLSFHSILFMFSLSVGRTGFKLYHFEDNLGSGQANLFGHKASRDRAPRPIV